jgi:hypothetical protein
LAASQEGLRSMSKYEMLVYAYDINLLEERNAMKEKAGTLSRGSYRRKRIED